MSEILSNKYANSLQLALRPSPILLALLLCAALGAVVIVLSLPLDWPWQTLGVIAIAVIAIMALWSLIGPPGLVSLRLNPDGSCGLWHRDGSHQVLWPQRAIVHYYWLRLSLGHPESKVSRQVLIVFDALEAEQFRRLRASLNLRDWQA